MKLEDVFSQKQLEQSAQFMHAALKAKSCLKFGKSCEFVCPVCAATAKAEKSNFNGHLHARCPKCKCEMIE